MSVRPSNILLAKRLSDVWLDGRAEGRWVLSHSLMSDNLLANRILDGRTDTWFSAKTLNPDTPKRIPITLSDTWHWGIPWHWVIPNTLSDTHYGHTQEDTQYTKWYPLRTHPRGYPLHWVIPIMDTPKMIPITLSDTHYGHTQDDTHYTEWYPLRTHPRGYPLH